MVGKLKVKQKLGSSNSFLSAAFIRTSMVILDNDMELPRPRRFLLL